MSTQKNDIPYDDLFIKYHHSKYASKVESKDALKDAPKDAPKDSSKVESKTDIELKTFAEEARDASRKALSQNRLLTQPQAMPQAVPQAVPKDKAEADTPKTMSEEDIAFAHKAWDKIVKEAEVDAVRNAQSTLDELAIVQDEKSRIEKELISLRNTHDTLQAEYGNIFSSRDNIRLENSNLKTSLNWEKDRNSVLMLQLEEKKMNGNYEQNVTQALKEQLSKVQHQKEELQVEKDRLLDRNDQFEKKSSRDESVIKSLAEQLSQIQHQKEDLQLALINARCGLQHASDDLRNYSTVESENKDLQAELTFKNEKYSELCAENDKIKADLNQTRNELNQARNDLEQTRSDLDEVTAHLIQLEHEATTMVDTTNSDEELKVPYVKELKRNMQKDEEIANLQERLVNLRAEFENSGMKNMSLLEDNAKLQANFDKLLEYNEELRIQYAKELKRNMQKDEDISILRERLVNLRAQYENSEMKSLSLQEENDKIKANYAELDDITNLRKENEALRNDLDETTSKLIESKDEVEQLQEKLRNDNGDELRCNWCKSEMLTVERNKIALERDNLQESCNGLREACQYLMRINNDLLAKFERFACDLYSTKDDHQITKDELQNTKTELIQTRNDLDETTAKLIESNEVAETLNFHCRKMIKDLVQLGDVNVQESKMLAAERQRVADVENVNEELTSKNNAISTELQQVRDELNETTARLIEQTESSGVSQGNFEKMHDNMCTQYHELKKSYDTVRASYERIYIKYMDTREELARVKEIASKMAAQFK